MFILSGRPSQLTSDDCYRGLQWFFFMLLDIGQRGVEDIPLNVRFSAGLFQAVAVRAAGFVIIQINTLAPAVQ